MNSRTRNLQGRYLRSPSPISMILWGGGQNLERRNVERSVFQNFEITNIKMKKDKLFHHFISELFSYFLETILQLLRTYFYFQKLFEYPKYFIIFDIVKY